MYVWPPFHFHIRKTTLITRNLSMDKLLHQSTGIVGASVFFLFYESMNIEVTIFNRNSRLHVFPYLFLFTIYVVFSTPHRPRRGTVVSTPQKHSNRRVTLAALAYPLHSLRIPNILLFELTFFLGRFTVVSSALLWSLGYMLLFRLEWVVQRKLLFLVF